MASFIDAVIVSGPNEGRTVGECITSNMIPRDVDIRQRAATLGEQMYARIAAAPPPAPVVVPAVSDEEMRGGKQRNGRRHTAVDRKDLK